VFEKSQGGDIAEERGGIADSWDVVQLIPRLLVLDFPKYIWLFTFVRFKKEYQTNRRVTARMKYTSTMTKAQARCQ
jgi:hypothetical protein